MCWQGCGEIRNVKWCGFYGKQYGGSPKQLKIELPYDPVVPLLGVFPKELNQGVAQPLYTHVHSGIIHGTVAQRWK